MGLTKLLLISGGLLSGAAGGSFGVLKLVELYSPKKIKEVYKSAVDQDPEGNDTEEEIIDPPEEGALLWEIFSSEGERDTCQWSVVRKKEYYDGNLEIRTEEKYGCVTEWYKNIKSKNQNRQGLWIRGKENSVTELLKEWQDNHSLRDNSERTYKINQNIDELSKFCGIERKENKSSKEKTVEISCLEE